MFRRRDTFSHWFGETLYIITIIDFKFLYKSLYANVDSSYGKMDSGCGNRILVLVKS